MSSRRECLLLVPGVVVGGAAAFSGAAPAGLPASPDAAQAAMDALPSQDPALVMEMVGASHGRVDRVRELLSEMPQLANAAVDWGFGDWETALGAASHTGRRAIAEMLIEHGARPDVFTLAMMGHLDALRAVVAAMPGIQRTLGPHGITLMSHARAGGEPAKSVVEYLAHLGDADRRAAGVPVPDEMRAAILGSYAFGEGERDRFEVTEKDGVLWLARSGRPGRTLTHVGDGAFHPAGAPQVRIRFEVAGGPASRVEITAPRPVVVAQRR